MRLWKHGGFVREMDFAMAREGVEQMEVAELRWASSPTLLMGFWHGMQFPLCLHLHSLSHELHLLGGPCQVQVELGVFCFFFSVFALFTFVSFAGGRLG